jgi:prepilin-type N-terminal cleavage/methylation domain-containing protein
MIRNSKFQNPNSKSRGLPRTNAFATRTRSIREQLSFVRGYSIVELLVTLTVFAIIAIISTQAVVLSLRGTRKGESLISTRENLDFAFGVMERQLRSARSITSCASDQLVYEDEERIVTNFSCVGESDGYLASGSARLTSNEVNVDCTGIIFSCPAVAPGVPPTVIISATAQDADSQGIEGSSVTASTRILLRTY